MRPVPRRVRALLLPVALLGMLPRAGAAARPVVFTGDPVVVRLQLRQPTAVQFPEPIAAVPTGADPHTLSLELEGPRLFLQPLTRDVQGQLFALGVSGRSYPLRFAVRRPADTEVVVTLPPPAAPAAPGVAPVGEVAGQAPPGLASPVTVRDLLVGMLRDTPPPGVSVAPHTQVVLETATLRITTVRAYVAGPLQGYVAEAANRTAEPLPLRLPEYDAPGLKALSAAAEVLPPQGTTTVYLVFQPLWLRTLGRWGRQHPGAVVLLAALGGLVGYWQLQPPRPPVPRTTSAGAQPFTGTLPAQVSLESALATVQRENEQLKQILAEQQRTLARLERDQQTRQQDAAAQAQRLEAALQQVLATADLARRPPPTPAPAAAPVRPPAPPKPPPVLRILRPATEPTPLPAPVVPAGPAPTWVQLPAGSFVRGRLLTGLFATTHTGGALPALFAVREAFTGPNQTAIPLQGCLALGKALADLASLRAIVQLTTLACVWPDGRTFEQAVAGYATGRDGTLGLPGRLEQRAGVYLGRTFLASLVAGAAEAFAQAERTTQITPLGGSQSVVTGETGKFAAFSALSTASARVADFYLAQAEQLLPVVWVESGLDVQLVLQQGVTLEGLPATAALPRPRGFGASGFE
jgi:hypothetical protein